MEGNFPLHLKSLHILTQDMYLVHMLVCTYVHMNIRMYTHWQVHFAMTSALKTETPQGSLPATLKIKLKMSSNAFGSEALPVHMIHPSIRAHIHTHIHLLTTYIHTYCACMNYVGISRSGVVLYTSITIVKGQQKVPVSIQRGSSARLGLTGWLKGEGTAEHTPALPHICCLIKYSYAHTWILRHP